MKKKKETSRTQRAVKRNIERSYNPKYTMLYEKYLKHQYLNDTLPEGMKNDTKKITFFLSLLTNFESYVESRILHVKLGGHFRAVLITEGAGR